MPALTPILRDQLQQGVVIPAHPLALDAAGRLDERYQRALTRYYAAAGAGGLAVGVHTTQFAIRDPRVGLFEPVLALAAEEMTRADGSRPTPLIRIGGVCGSTAQAVREAELLARLGYHAGLVSLAALHEAPDRDLAAHCRQIAEVLPIVGFYLQPAVGGRALSAAFWRDVARIERLVAIKIAPFNRYQTLDVVRAIAESGRDDIALYTGNDDNIVADLVTPFRFRVDGRTVERRIVGGLLGQWAVWTEAAVRLLADCHAAAAEGTVPADLLARGVELTDANAALFDAENGFGGCIAGLLEILRRQGLVGTRRCLDPAETLGRGQLEAIDRVCRVYPHLVDDGFVRGHLAAWLRS